MQYLMHIYHSEADWAKIAVQGLCHCGTEAA
jgi:hypothetical protein